MLQTAVPARRAGPDRYGPTWSWPGPRRTSGKRLAAPGRWLHPLPGRTSRSLSRPSTGGQQRACRPRLGSGQPGEQNLPSRLGMPGGRAWQRAGMTLVRKLARPAMGHLHRNRRALAPATRNPGCRRRGTPARTPTGKPCRGFLHRALRSAPTGRSALLCPPLPQGRTMPQPAGPSRWQGTGRRKGSGTRMPGRALQGIGPARAAGLTAWAWQSAKASGGIMASGVPPAAPV
jgi:hypothetical protein